MTLPLRSRLLEGKVRHRRAGATPYALEHDVAYLGLDIDELDAVDRGLRLVGRNRRAVLEFRDDDHWPEPATDLRATVLAHLRSGGDDPTGWRITLVANPRVLGYVFNPASFYLCRDAAGVLRTVIVEVHNTHLERHLYTLRPGDGREPGEERRPGRFVASMDKAFYVSPFIDMEGRYTVHVRDDETSLRIAITERRGDAPVLATSLVLACRRLTDRNVLRMLLRYPLVTHRTIALIHWHALRLWLKGVPFQRHGAARPMPPQAPLGPGAAHGAVRPTAGATR